jgi:hypothetical protein
MTPPCGSLATSGEFYSDQQKRLQPLAVWIGKGHHHPWNGLHVYLQTTLSQIVRRLTFLTLSLTGRFI